ncbi:MAG: DUF1304 domain-containing protein [Rhodobacteraceae bacterium]|nr:DUF1304 domain-containing protein [Paracoccaceae bacterium]
MPLAAEILIGLIAALHLYILWMEMFAWESRGPKVFRAVPKDLFASTKAMMANQGLYNGFLAAGLIWALVAGPELARPLAIFFLGCVAIAGIYGALTAARRIFWIQGAPALLALAVIGLS